jgi:hypothetical protein
MLCKKSRRPGNPLFRAGDDGAPNAKIENGQQLAEARRYH